MRDHHIANAIDFKRKQIRGWQQSEYRTSWTQEFHRQVDLMNQSARYAAPEVLSRDIAFAVILIRMPVAYPVANLTLENQWLSGSFTLQKLLYDFYSRGELKIVAH